MSPTPRLTFVLGNALSDQSKFHLALGSTTEKTTLDGARKRPTPPALENALQVTVPQDFLLRIYVVSKTIVKTGTALAKDGRDEEMCIYRLTNHW
jgi:hypothetical protein